jgi:hypothetical protein
MVEKWLQSKGNPYTKSKGNPYTNRPVQRKVAPLGNPFVKVRPTMSKSKPTFKKKVAYYGYPSQLFKDSDKDGVANVFDCKPYNKRKQDGSALDSMWGRAEEARRQAAAARQAAIDLKIQMDKQDQANAELQRIQGQNTSSVYYIERGSGGGGAVTPSPGGASSSGTSSAYTGNTGSGSSKPYVVAPSVTIPLTTTRSSNTGSTGGSSSWWSNLGTALVKAATNAAKTLPLSGSKK